VEKWCSILADQSAEVESSQFHSDQLNHGFFQFPFPIFGKSVWLGDLE
jgi:hypothetical protein